MEIAGCKVEKGERKKLQLFVARLYDSTEMSIPVEVIRGKKDGPTLFVCAAIHGNEINGVEIIRVLSKQKILKELSGTLILIPIVNIFGFNNKTRYLPDRRDLNRCFPGAESGSLASRMANIFMNEIVSKSDYGIDLHTGANHRSNLPQIRAELSYKNNLELAKAFGTPVILNSNIRDGSLRQAAMDLGIPLLLFEGGEALRFNSSAIRLGVKGILNFMHKIKMVDKKVSLNLKKSFVAQSSYWLRAPSSGILHSRKKIGETVKEGQTIGMITDPFGKRKDKLIAPKQGLIIGASVLPLVSNGDAIYHIAVSESLNHIEDVILSSDEAIGGDLFDPQIEEEA